QGRHRGEEQREAKSQDPPSGRGHPEGAAEDRLQHRPAQEERDEEDEREYPGDQRRLQLEIALVVEDQGESAEYDQDRRRDQRRRRDAAGESQRKAESDDGRNED